MGKSHGFRARARGPFVLVLFVVIGAFGVLLVVGGLHDRALLQPVAGWTTTTGRVVGSYSDSVRSGHVYRPIVSFTDAGGRSHRFVAPSGSHRPEVGAAARVSYDPANPTHAHDLSASSSTWTLPFGIGVVVLLVALIGLGVVGTELRRRRAAQADVDGSSSR